MVTVLLVFAESDLYAAPQGIVVSTPYSLVAAYRHNGRIANRGYALQNLATILLLVLNGLDDALAGGGAGGEEAGEDADEEAGEEGCEGREFGVVEVDLEAPCA